MTHTPGPWNAQRAEGKRGELGVFEVKAASDIADGFGHRSVVNDKAALDEANARLIAAAPELLKACERAERAWKIFGLPEKDVVGQLQAAIALATGGDSK